MNCKNCGAVLGDGDMFCPECGSKQEPMQYVRPNVCQYCGTQLEVGAEFCQNCGAKVGAPASVPPRPNPVNSYNTNTQKQSGNTATVILIVALVLVIAVGAGLVIYMLYGRNVNNSQSETSVAVETEVSTEAPTPAPPPPHFDWVSASTTRNYDVDSSTGEICHYYPEYAVDGDMRTAWTPDRNRDSRPTFTLNANDNQYVSGIRMTNGYCKSEKTYTKNRRITRVRVSYNGGEKEASFGIENYRTMLEVLFDEPVYTDYITITVLDSYYGDWKDIAISEIEVF